MEFMSKENSFPQPSLNLTAIASSLNEDSPQVQGTLYILDGQYAYRHRETVRHGGDTFEQYSIKFLSPESVRSAFAQIPVDSGYFPVGTVRFGMSGAKTWLVKFLEPHKRSLDLILADGSCKGIEIGLPPLLSIGIGTRYFIWAMKSRQFDPDAPVFFAPFPNINTNDGSICFGTNHAPSCSASTFARAVNLFFETPFNEDHSSGKSRKFPDDIRKALMALAGSKTKRYPLNDLVPLTKKDYGQPENAVPAGELIDSLLKRYCHV